MSFEFTLYAALVSIDVPAENASEVVDALEHDMGSTLATKQDIALLRPAGWKIIPKSRRSLVLTVWV